MKGGFGLAAGMLTKPKRRSAQRRHEPVLPSAGERSRRLEQARVRARQTKGPAGSRSLKFKWAEAVSEKDWHIYRLAMKALRAGAIPFMLGGGFALAT